MARKDSNWKHILFIVLMYAVTVPALYAYLAWNKVDTPFAYEFLQRLGIAGVENLSDAGVRDLWFFEMSQFYGVATGISLLMVVIWNVIFWKAGAPGRRSLENILFTVFIALHILMTLLVAIISGIFGFAASMKLDIYDVLAYYGMFLLNIPFVLSLWLFSPVGMRSALFKKW